MLEDWVDSQPFSAAVLHNKVLSVPKHERPERAQNGKRRKMECRRTPIHIMRAADPKLPSTEIGRRRLPSLQVPDGDSSEPISGSTSSEAKGTPFSKHDGYRQELLNNSDGGNFKVPPSHHLSRPGRRSESGFRQLREMASLVPRAGQIRHN